MTTKYLESDEFAYGGYKVQYVTWNDQQREWIGTGFWLRAVITNRRMLVFPEMGEYPRDWEIVKSADIRKAWSVTLQGRDGILIRLHDNRCLYMLVDWSQSSKLVKDIRKLIHPPARPRISPRPVNV
jgi:hypothetical protein